MKNLKFKGQNIPNMPWEDRPEGIKSPVWRYSQNPIIKRNPIDKISRIFNSAVIYDEGRYYGIFRAENHSTLPKLHFGISPDGLNWQIESVPLELIDEAGRKNNLYYGYDPRLAKVEDKFYITFCTDFYGPTIGLIETADFKTFVRRENVYIPFNRNGVLFPRRINGNYQILSRPSDNGHTPFGDIFLSESPDLTYWGRHRHVMERGGTGWWQGLKIGAGPNPIETDIGWLLLYHGVTNTCNGYVYSMGGAVLDINQPSKVLYRSKYYLLTPELDYEVAGFVANVVFPCSALLHQDGRMTIYYGAADTYTALAFSRIDLILDFIIENSERVGSDHEIGK
ncbi:MAG: glycoside hydrolase family 130 protein [Endomicrobiaceae bacterium]|nr:glycoside hydrolase family 130 protein [Endomicrobiaceae bacterium]